MKNKKFVYNPNTLKYEEYKRGGWSLFYKIAGIGLVVIFMATGLFFAADYIFPSEKEKALQSKLNRMELKYQSVNDKIDMMSSVLSNIRERDESVYKIMFGMEPIDKGLWEGGIGGHEIDDYNNSDKLIKQTTNRINKLERQFVLQSKSLEEVESLAKEREKKLAATPSIKPVRTEALKYDVKLLSGFGMRIHPIQKIKKMHTGMDFTCPRGTIIHATGDGVVSEVRNSSTGYGRHIVIDHGYNFKTLYGHMYDIDVKEGQKVERGQKIGTVGSTGSSTAPHVHYEVHLNGKAVNPINYVMDGLTPEEYAELVRLSKIQNQSFD